MRLLRVSGPRLFAVAVLAAFCVVSSMAPAQNHSNPGRETKSQACSNDDSGLQLPAGFCATVFADDVGHARHMGVGPSGEVYVNTWSGEIYGEASMCVAVSTATNSRQLQNRTPKSTGENPCTELVTRGGIWRYDENKTNQTFSPAGRFATGIRNAEGFALDSTGHRVFVTQHGRDQLYTNWPALYKPDQEATQPAEELLLLRAGGDYGWPECYYDAGAEKLVLAPEYGGGGGEKGGPWANQPPPPPALSAP